MVVRHVLSNDGSQMLLTQQHDVVEAVVSDRAHESLRVRVQVRTSRGQPQRFYVGVAKQPSERGRVERVAVEDEVPLAQQKAVDRIEQVASDLHHPLAVRLMDDACDLDATRLQLDHEVKLAGVAGPAVERDWPG